MNHENTQQMQNKMITVPDLESITDLDLAFGTTRFLASPADIPAEFNQQANIYVQLVNALFYGLKLPQADITFRRDLLSEDPDGIGSLVMRCTVAHLRSFEPKHEHKIAGVAYLVSQLCELRRAQ